MSENPDFPITIAVTVNLGGPNLSRKSDDHPNGSSTAPKILLAGSPTFEVKTGGAGRLDVTIVYTDGTYDLTFSFTGEKGTYAYSINGGGKWKTPTPIPTSQSGPPYGVTFTADYA